LYPLYVADRDGPLNADQADGWYEHQVTSVGDTREQAQGLSDELTALVLSASLTVTGYTVGPTKLTTDVGVERDDDVEPPIYYTIQMFTTFLTPT
jgi:hypothetical protein